METDLSLMKRGEWYVAKGPANDRWLIFKLDRYEPRDNRTYYTLLYAEGDNYTRSNDYCSVIYGYRKATKEEVLSKFPNENFKRMFS